ncbi:MAG: VWA domain-containing protein [Gammaproteobacteria bacterium]|nr:VWA domain-containing protein [Gammaproteobacteria bacterium]
MFHFLRPEWFWLLLPLALLAWLLWRRRQDQRGWAAVVDPQLLPHLIVDQQGKRRRGLTLLWLFLGLLAIIALAGPVWDKLPLPVLKQQSALVIALDLSQSMDAEDIKPSRLARARLKVSDLLQQRREGQTALIAFAATAYTVTPLTDDIKTIQSLLSSLETDIMPAQGSRTDQAVASAVELFRNAGIANGDILLISDGISARVGELIQRLDTRGYRLSVMAVGSENGAPIPQRGGGFVKDRQGSIVVSRTDPGQLQQLAQAKGGVYTPMTIDDSDLQRLAGHFDRDLLTAQHQRSELKADRWQEQGPWLLLLVTPLAALAFRRGFILPVVLAALVLPAPQTGLADEISWWDRLWYNKNQLGQRQLQQGEAEAAAQTFGDDAWKAAAHYQANQYQQALQHLEGLESVTADYNRANTLARLGEYQQALDNYDRVLATEPRHEDAAHNRELVRQALEQQQRQQQQQQQQQQNQQSQQDQQSAEQQPSQPDSAGQQDQEAAGEQQQNQQDSTAEADQQQQQQQQQPAQQEQQQQAEDAGEQQRQPIASDDLTEQMSQQAQEQWLRRIPDDPGGLLRNKFRYQYGRQTQPSREREPW